MIRLAILAPTPALRSGLRALLAANDRIEVISEAAVISDLEELDGLDVLLIGGSAISLDPLRNELEKASSPPALLLLAEDPQMARSLASLSARAWGLLPPDVGEEELLAAVIAVHEGLLTASPALMQPLLGPVAQLEETEDILEELTERESEVLQLLAQGMANKQIALRLSISEHTVKFHVSSIYAKLSVTNRTEAARRGARLGLIVL
ncbi:MAG TPA: response regulator transcription factor [Anaerolineales bacterium]|nr:response regulator transcription factor [Anaerolineales bacterium]